MKKVLKVLVVLGVGVALGRLFVAPSPRAEAGGGEPLPPCQDINGDGSSNLTDAIYFLNWLFQGGQAPTCPATNGKLVGLPDTGQTTCYDGAGNLIDCASATCAGQDGFHATGCSSEGRFTDNGDGTVTDHCTGLMWQRDTADVNEDGQSTDRDFVTWCGALAYCEGLSFAGHDDWRLPNVRELQSILDYGRLSPSIDPVFRALRYYWSSTSTPGDPAHPWVVDFGVGRFELGDGENYSYVRAVRPGP
jgi:hypothetical protein